MTIVFRTDAANRMGTGHVMRCLALAEALQAGGAQTSFVCREHQGHLIEMLRGKSLCVSALPPPPPQRRLAKDNHATELGVPQSVDAEHTIQALQGNTPDWLVVDHYALGAEWEERLRSHVGRILVIDDLANRHHDCDVLLDQNRSAGGESRHNGLMPDRCQLLLGPRYALLSQQYASYRETQSPRDGTVRRVLIYFGGADPSNMTGKALTALSAPEFSHLAVDLVIGTNHPCRESLEIQAAGRPGTGVHGTRPHLADLMTSAGLAIGAGGVTTWERMCLGLPSIVVSLAENQRPTCEALAADGLIEYVGDVGSVEAVQIRDALNCLLDNRDRLIALSSRGRLLVDGRGASRVADVILPDPSDEPAETRHRAPQTRVS